MDNKKGNYLKIPLNFLHKLHNTLNSYLLAIATKGEGKFNSSPVLPSPPPTLKIWKKGNSLMLEINYYYKK